MIYYHDHPEYRIGDEIQTIAVLKYLKSKGFTFYYKDANCFFSSMSLFPDDIAIFCSENLYNYPHFKPWNLWFWNSLCKNKGFYTELKIKYDEKIADIDVVFIPVLGAEYNCPREINPYCAYNLFQQIQKRNNNSVMIIDKNKKSLLDVDHPNVIYSDNIYTTFQYINRSKIFIGMDTGTSHYAGALKHPRMILIHAGIDYMNDLNEMHSWHKKLISQEHNEPELLNIKLDALPCCDPKQYSVLRLSNNQIETKKIIEIIESYKY